MSDYNSSLPIRTENAGDAIVKVADATVTSRQLTVNADGSVNITDNGGSLTVDGSVTVSATDLDIRDLVFATDKVDVSNSTVALDAGTLAALESITVQNGAGASAVNIQDGGNSITVDATNLDIRDLSAAQDNVAISDGTDTLAVNNDGSINAVVSATNLDIRDLTHVSDSVKIGDGTDFLAVNTDGSINVKITDASPGTDVNDYNTAASLAGGGTSNHDYTSTGNFYLTQIEASGSGKMKIEVLVNSVSKFVQFNSTANPNMSITLKQPILATTGQVVRVIRTNRENQAQDVYSTISGYTE